MSIDERTLRVGVIGDIYVDLLCKVDELPVWGEDRLASATLLSPGGSTANTARFLGSLGGVAVRLFSAVGDDAFGAYFREQLEAEACAAIDGSVAVLTGVPTSVCVVLSGPSDRGFVSCNSTNGALEPGMFSREALLAQQHVHIGGYFNMPQMHTPVLCELARTLRAAGVTLSLDSQFDTSGAWDGRGTLAELLREVDVFMPNDKEAQGVCRTATPDDALEALCAPGRMRPGALALVKCGARGVIAGRAGSAERWHVDSPRVDVVDATGAGDAFNAAFLHAFMRGEPVERCLRAGTEAGALAVQRIGGCERVHEWARELHTRLALLHGR
ncbi:hypothetical protein KFE25_008100 [Diacronema lutheri]|uniref:Carbohydrate kinase PfkB domain-containing protein n=1 Tax=Diacronema lutheri TaxID=2081491 RepID=A0A8J5XDI8_DIALT|nr:hypothetical protein KFE25_008100 [Diacronema lutheri]